MSAQPQCVAVACLAVVAALAVYGAALSGAYGGQRAGRGATKVIVPDRTRLDARQPLRAASGGTAAPGQPFAPAALPTGPLVPEKLLSADAAAHQLSCQRESFARHKRSSAAPPRFVILQSTNFAGKGCEVPYLLNRAAWAEAFGHEFVHAKMPSDVHGYGKAASAKPRIMLAELQRHMGDRSGPGGRNSSVEWVVWMDADTFVNPLDPPDLEALVRGAPPGKHLLVTQTEYLNSGVVFLRVGAGAVALLEQWVAVMDSGVIGCHPWDQGGLQWMYAHAVNSSFPLSTVCKPPACGGDPGGKFWSCTPIFETQMLKAYGAKSAAQCALTNDDTGALGVLPDRDKDTVLHCWGCFNPDVCDALETQASNPFASKEACQNAQRRKMLYVSQKCRRPDGRPAGEFPIPGGKAKFQMAHGGMPTGDGRAFNFFYAKCLGGPLNTNTKPWAVSSG